MARCGCRGGACGCLVVGGENVVVSGNGSADNPYVVNVNTATITDVLAVADTTTIDLTLDGSGTEADPFVISGVATLTMSDLIDVADPEGPTVGDVPVWVDDGEGGHWEFRPPPTVPPGTVSTGAGITGDGSASSPIAVNVSGTWGSGALSGYGTDTTLGSPTYIDANGQVRTRPLGAEFLAPGATRPAQYPGRTIIQNGQLWVSDGATWTMIGPDAWEWTRSIGGSPTGWSASSGSNLSIAYRFGPTRFIRLSSRKTAGGNLEAASDAGSLADTLIFTLSGDWIPPAGTACTFLYGSDSGGGFIGGTFGGHARIEPDGRVFVVSIAPWTRIMQRQSGQSSLTLFASWISSPPGGPIPATGALDGASVATLSDPGTHPGTGLVVEGNFVS